MSFDLAKALRRLKPQKVLTASPKRPDAELRFVDESPGPGRELLLDTCVYIDVLQGRTPAHVDRLIQLRLANHSSVCLSELTHLFGRLDPADTRTRASLREIARTIDDIPAHRLTTPSEEAAGEAGIMAGLAARLRGVAPGQNQRVLNDASIYAQAIERGFVVLTSNIRDFDFFDRIWPNDSVLFYRPEVRRERGRRRVDPEAKPL